MVYCLLFDVKKLQIWKYVVKDLSNPLQELTLRSTAQLKKIGCEMADYVKGEGE